MIKQKKSKITECIPEHMREVNRCPPGVPMARWMEGRPKGIGPELAAYRGEHHGCIDAVITLQNMGHTRIAAKLQKHYGLNDDGSITL